MPLFRETYSSRELDIRLRTGAAIALGIFVGAVIAGGVLALVTVLVP